MKKLLIVLALAAIISTGTAFADHPSGFGIGIQAGGYAGHWDRGHYGDGRFNHGAALSLVIPGVPIFWAIDLDIYNDWFNLGVSGDYYFIDNPLFPQIFMNWYLGFGVGIGISSWDAPKGHKGDTFWLSALARLPIGVDWQIPINAKPLTTLEIYLQIVPCLGFQFVPDFYFPAGGFPVNIGLRLWFN